MPFLFFEKNVRKPRVWGIGIPIKIKTRKWYSCQIGDTVIHGWILLLKTRKIKTSVSINFKQTQRFQDSSILNYSYPIRARSPPVIHYRCSIKFLRDYALMEILIPHTLDLDIINALAIHLTNLFTQCNFICQD